MKVFHRSFAGGVVDPEMFGRIDEVKYQTGLRSCRNLITKPHGSAMRRPGSVYVNAARGRARLLPFVYSRTDALAIELCARVFIDADTATGVTSTTLTKSTAAWTSNQYAGAYVECNGSVGYIESNTATALTITFWHGPQPSGTLTFTVYIGSIRFHSDGATVAAPAASAYNALTTYIQGDTVSSGGVTYYSRASSNAGNTPSSSPKWWYAMPTTGEYELPHHLGPDMLDEATFVQSLDVVTIAHDLFLPTELRRYSATFWTLVSMSFDPELSPPGGMLGEASDPGSEKLYVNSITVGSGGLSVLINTTTPHGLINGDQIYIEGTLVSAINDKYWIVVHDSSISSGPGNFRIREPETGAYGPAGSSVTAGGTVEYVPLNSQRENTYVVTAIAASGSESQPSAEVTVTNNLFAAGASNNVTWNVVSGAERYRVFKKLNGLFGVIGEVEEDGSSFYTFNDDNIEPDLSVTPPLFDTTLDDDYPGAVGYFEQRKCFAGTYLQPQALYMTRTGSESDLTYRIPVLDTDRIRLTSSGLSASPIRHIVSLNQLVLLTDSAEIRVSPVNSDAITPASVAARAQSYQGASRTSPIVVNNEVLFAAARGGHVHALGFQATADSYVTRDLCLRAAHLFDGYEIRALAFQRAPLPIVWAVSSSGSLLGLTYSPAEEVAGWHEHTFAGDVEAVCVVPEGDEDRVYIVVAREIDSATVRYVERLASFAAPATAAAGVFVDSAITFSSVGSGSLAGLDHLEGETVAVLADGKVLPQKTVASGAITLPAAYSTVTVGLPIDAELEPLPVVLPIDAYGAGDRKNACRLRFRVKSSGVFHVGPSATALVASDPDAPVETLDTATAETLTSGVVDVRPHGEWSDDGRAVVQLPHPLPFTLVSIAIEVSYGR